jgi:hypothetical protein
MIAVRFQALRLVISFTALGLLAACASTNKFEAKVRSWEGRDVAALLEAWGQPDDKQTVHGDHTMYVYSRLKRIPVANSDPSGSVASVRKPAEYSDLYIKCSTYFEADAHSKIIATEFRGPECTSRD